MSEVELSLAERVMGLGDQIFLLKQSLDASETDQRNFIDVIHRLRLLLCDKNRNDALLLRLMDELDVSYQIPPPQDGPGSRPPSRTLINPTESVETPIDLRTWVERCFVVFHSGREYSFGDLIWEVANKLGPSHLDEKVPSSLVDMRDTSFMGQTSYVYALRPAAHQAYEAGIVTLAVARSKGLISGPAGNDT